MSAAPREHGRGRDDTAHASSRSADEFWCVQGRTCGNAGLQRTRWRPGGVARRAFGPGDGVYESLAAVASPEKFRPCDRRQPSSRPRLSPSVVLRPLPIVLHGLQPPTRRLAPRDVSSLVMFSPLSSGIALVVRAEPSGASSQLRGPLKTAACRHSLRHTPPPLQWHRTIHAVCPRRQNRSSRRPGDDTPPCAQPRRHGSSSRSRTSTSTRTSLCRCSDLASCFPAPPARSASFRPRVRRDRPIFVEIQTCRTAVLAVSRGGQNAPPPGRSHSRDGILASRTRRRAWLHVAFARETLGARGIVVRDVETRRLKIGGSGSPLDRSPRRNSARSRRRRPPPAAGT